MYICHRAKTIFDAFLNENSLDSEKIIDVWTQDGNLNYLSYEELPAVI